MVQNLLCHYLNCMMMKTILQDECCKTMLTATFLWNNYKIVTKETVVCFIETMLIQENQGTKHLEAGP